ncbi:hypothetical protein B0H16DRAFT_1450444 [Mycena metata]|uniref:Uncharacterized protein n=1 Tax=Mycena metata TaxID=1033252 RepID=A0AAD7JZ87_9AGAR|nr:hypothetical protein B0H16DRAFT_1450444 [Mycena metata]
MATVGVHQGAAGEFGTVTSMFKPAIPPSSTLHWAGKKWKIILQGFKIAPAELYHKIITEITFLPETPENAWLQRGRGRPQKAKAAGACIAMFYVFFRLFETWVKRNRAARIIQGTLGAAYGSSSFKLPAWR